jgi:hypothetical protein
LFTLILIAPDYAGLVWKNRKTFGESLSHPTIGAKVILGDRQRVGLFPQISQRYDTRATQLALRIPNKNG